VTRRQERELREAQAIVALVDGVLKNWGIEMHRGEDLPGYDDDREHDEVYALIIDDDREPSERFAAQVGEGEAVEHDEVYALIIDVAKEAYAAAGNGRTSGIDNSYERAAAELAQFDQTRKDSNE